MPKPVAFFEFGVFRLDVANCLLLRDDEPVALTPKAFETLSVLLRNHRRVVSKEELIEEIWPGLFVSDATLTQNIYVLRKALETSEGSRWIRTVPRRGYRFEGELSAIPASPVTMETELDTVRGGVSSHGSSSVLEMEAIGSVAVLPFRALSTDAEDEFLGLGMADAVITSLSNVRLLAVRATSAILPYVDRDERDPVQIGSELGVDGVLEGTVQQSGSLLRVTVQLVSVARGVACWAESFQGAYSDLFAAQDAVAREVVSRLRVSLTRQEEDRLIRRPTQNLDAYRAYVRGRYLWNKRTSLDLRRAIELFREAASLDSDYAQAYAGLADALILLPFYGTARPADSFRQARDAARTALSLDDNIAEAHTSLAYTDFVYSRLWRGAEERFRHALECGPNYATAYHWYAFMLTALGRHDEAIRLATRAQELDPLSLVISTDLAIAHYFARQFDLAAERLGDVLEVAPDFGYAHFGLALCLVELGIYERAIEAAGRAVELLADSAACRAVLGHALARGQRPAEARRMLDSLDQSGNAALPLSAQASHRALILTGLGELDAALVELDQGIEDRSRFVAFLGVWPVFDPLRADQRFSRLLERLGLVEGHGA